MVIVKAMPHPMRVNNSHFPGSIQSVRCLTLTAVVLLSRVSGGNGGGQ